MYKQADSPVGDQPFQHHCKPIRWLNSWLTSLLFGFAMSLLLPGLACADQAHYFVLKEAADGSIGVDFHQFVEMNGTLDSNLTPSLQSNSERRLKAALSNKISGAVVFNTVAFGSPWLRGEFHGNGEIDGRVLPVNDSFYVVRIPVQKGTTLRVEADRDRTAISPGAGSTTPALPGTVLEVDLDSYASPIARTLMPALPAGYVSGNVSQNGPPSNRLDLLIVAEGYTASQQSQFVIQVTTLANTMLSIAPYSSFSHLINVSWLFVPSNQSGTDKPNCPETPGSAVVFVDTAFDGTFCTSNIRRLVTVNTSKVLAAAANVPDWDKILVLVNDGEYGGSGGTLGVATSHALSAEIMQHEFGHMFSRLADEYESAYPGFPACNDLLSTSPCEANVTNQSLRANVKWAAWIDLTTSVPTIGPLTDPTASGLWQGARYQTAGMYRQCFNGIMRSLGRPFCHVDSEAFVKRLYGGWGGAPTQGVSLIEPDAIPASSAVSAPIQTDIAFQGTLAGSRAAGGLTYTWLVNGISQKAGVSTHGEQQSFTYRVANAGPNTIELRVSDSTPLMLTAPLRSRLWTVQGTANTGSFGLSISKIGSGTVTSNPAGISCGTTCTASYTSGTSVTLTATPTTGGTFTAWGGACAGAVGTTCTVNMSAAKSVTATFATSATSTFPLGVTLSGTGSGIVTSNPSGVVVCRVGTCSTEIASDASVTLSAIAAVGSTFTGWSGDCTGTGSCTVSMSAAKNVTASFGLAGSATSGNDTLTNGTGNNTVDGLAGVDTYVSSGPRSRYTLTFGASSHTLIDLTGTEGTDTLTNIERLRFSDGVHALDIGAGQIGGTAYRIYKAAFNRTPDNGGLKYWMARMDTGTSLTDVAWGFIASAEFELRYGRNPTDGNFVTLLYLNVLGRGPDSGGYAYWINRLATGSSRQDVLIGFSESAENMAAVAPAISNGIWMPN